MLHGIAQKVRNTMNEIALLKLARVVLLFRLPPDRTAWFIRALFLNSLPTTANRGRCDEFGSLLEQGRVSLQWSVVKYRQSRRKTVTQSFRPKAQATVAGLPTVDLRGKFCQLY
jgi:hypothetical protein